MAANPQATFDIGPLSWVKTEIEHSLAEARTHLDKLSSDPGDAKAVKYIATHLHQVTGALSMVGLGAAARFNEEIEKLIGSFETDPVAKADAANRIAATRKAAGALSAYLDSLMSGEPDRPMMLASAYLALNKARGANDAAESDLFSPDLSIAVPMPEDTVALPKADMLAEAIKQRRGMYQAGLLKLLKDRDMVGGAREMRNATLAIEALQVTSPTRSFWYAAGGFFDAVAANPAEAGSLAVQLFGKIDQQIKLLIDGVQKVPEKLFRDLLLVIGKSRSQTERVKKIRELYRLDELLAIPDAGRDSGADDQLKVLLRGMREQVQAQKDNWLKYTSGNRAALEPFVSQGDALAKSAVQQPNKELAQLLQMLSAVGSHLKKTGVPPSEPQGLEVATALLFAESSLENYFRLTTDFASQAIGLIARVKGAMSGQQLPALDAGSNALMDDIARRAQERMLMFQVGQEVQVNLATIESTLDAFFRDPMKTAELATLPSLFSQVQGALTILELDEAAALNQMLRDRVTQFASGAMKGTGEDAEVVAEGVSGLGLYITALQQGSSQPRDVLLPALIRFGLAEKPAEAEQSMIKSPVSAGDVDVAKQKVQALYEDWKQSPEATATREQLRDAVQELKQEALLIADTASAKQSDDALKAIDSTFDPTITGVSAALSEIAPQKPTETPPAQVVQLIDAPAAEVDQELLEIFLEEATEVVATIQDNLATVKASPMDNEALTTIRRGFHTLKGSGRMVGLTDLGEVAWNCEQVMNKWLKDEKPASAGLMHFIEVSAKSFSVWVDSLKATGTAKIDGAEVSRMADLLKNDKEPEIPPATVAAHDAPPAHDAVAKVDSTAAVAAEAPLDFAVEPAVPEMEVSVPAPAPISVPDVAESPALTVDAPTFPDLSLDLAAPAPEPTIAPLSEPPPVESATATDMTSSLNLDDVFGELPMIESAPVESAPITEAMPALSVSESVAPEPAAIEQSEPVTAADDFFDEQHEVPTDVVIGDISVPAQLFGIYLGEADIHVVTLENEMDAIESNPMQPVSHDFMRAAHTLTSSSRTTGFEMIADVAFGLEKWLQDAIEIPPEWDTRRLGVTRQAVDALSGMVLALHSRELPEARPDLVEALASLREKLKSDRRSGEGTHLRMPVMPPIDAPAVAIEDILGAPNSESDAPSSPVETPPPAGEDAASIDFDMAVLARHEPEAALSPSATAPEADSFAAAIESFPDVAPVLEKTPESATFVAADAAVSAPPEPPPAPAHVAAPVFTEPTPVRVSPAHAEPQARFEAGKERRTVVDDIDADLLPIFLEEARELIPQVGDAIRRWRNVPANHEPVTELARHLHTLKGSARMAGLMRLGELAHVLEAKVIAMDGEATPATPRFDDVDNYLDRFNAAIDSLSKGELAPPVEIPIIIDAPEDLPAPMAKLAAARAEIVAEGEKLEGRERQALLRVNADMIDRFVNEAGELAIARSRIELEMMTFKSSLLELSDNVTRMKTQLREIEIQAESQIQSRIKEQQEAGADFDPLEFDRFSRTQELTRFMAESLNDVVTLQLSLQKNLDEAEAALLQQGRLNRDLQQGLMSVRLVPLGNLQDRFHRLVRQTAKELDKKANLEFRGTRVEIDRSVLEKITAPFEHLLRNAVAHGLETPDVRVAKGKSEIGEISIDAQQVGNEVMLILADDGAGLNFPRIREKAIEQGLMAPDDEVTEAQLTQFIFMAGFSTASEVTQVAGRGVGMDVVRNEIVSLGGRIDITSIPGRGTTFTIALPLTLAVTQAVMVKVGDTTYAIPSVMIEQVQEYKGKRYEPMLEMNEVEWKGNRYPLRSMEALLGGKPKVSAVRKAYVILAKSGQQRAAVQVDEIIGNREIVVKTIGPQLARLVGIAGATVTGAGQVILIINPVQLVFRETATVSVETQAGDAGSVSFEPAAHGGMETPSAAEAHVPPGPSLGQTIAATEEATPSRESPVLVRTAPLVMVVDDSLTVRKITSRMLTREGFEVATAKDGVDGLQQLQDIEPDIILLDIEMPRMDGFEFARNVRADAKTKGIPIIMITSRTADKHRNHAIEIGVNEYMGKPYQEEQLLALIRQYTSQRAAA
jgi:chemosensory pili system protein ChpA (sensor histidine kinase/response regulator)